MAMADLGATEYDRVHTPRIPRSDEAQRLLGSLAGAELDRGVISVPLDLGVLQVGEEGSGTRGPQIFGQLL